MGNQMSLTPDQLETMKAASECTNSFFFRASQASPSRFTSTSPHRAAGRPFGVFSDPTRLLFIMGLSSIVIIIVLIDALFVFSVMEIDPIDSFHSFHLHFHSNRSESVVSFS